MFIKKKEYELIKRMAEDNEHDADLFRSLIFSLNDAKILIAKDFVLMTKEAYDEIISELNQWMKENKELKAELEWYKVNYHEIKNSNN